MDMALGQATKTIAVTFVRTCPDSPLATSMIEISSHSSLLDTLLRQRYYLTLFQSYHDTSFLSCPVDDDRNDSAFWIIRQLEDIFFLFLFRCGFFVFALLTPFCQS